jgi:hypothetical protein
VVGGGADVNGGSVFGPGSGPSPWQKASISW